MRFLFLFVALVRCGGAAPGEPLGSVGTCPGSGTLVITELAIRGAGYVEIYNSGREGVELASVSISVAGSGAPRQLPLSGRVGAGRYTALPITTLADDGGTVEVSCAGQLIDALRYGHTESDILALDGSQPPDATFNDAIDHWCPQLGSAGGPNSGCGAAACDEGEAPRAGDVVISEVMRDPVGVDADGEWLELFNASGGSVILDGLVVDEQGSSARRFSLTAAPCLVVEAGAYVVLPLGGTDQPYLTRGSGLFNDKATLTLRLGTTALDEAEISCGRSGSSCALVDGEWCEATAPTPGEENACAP